MLARIVRRLAPGRATDPRGGVAERDARRAFFAKAKEHAPLLVAVTDLGRFLVSTSDQGVGRRVFVQRCATEEPTLARVVETLVRHGRPLRTGTFLEIGGNIGTTTVAALRRPEFTRAITCEAGSTNADLLATNLFLNGLADRATVVAKAIGDVAGTAVLALHEKSGLHAIAGSETGEHGFVGREEVPVTTLDALAESGVIDPHEIALLWIDVEGHEAAVLRGASTILTNAPPVVLEVNPETLHRGGGITVLVDAIPAVYPCFVQVGRGRESSAGNDKRPVEELPALAGTLEQATDILLVPEGP